MADPASVRAVALLVQEAHRAADDRDYVRALTAAEHAVQGALMLDDLATLMAAIAAEANARRQLGDHVTAIARYATIVSLAQQPRSRSANPEGIAREVGCAYLNLVVCARSESAHPRSDILDVLDTADQWLDVTGHRSWRAGFMLQRALVLQDLGDIAGAIRCAEDALAAYEPGAPGFPRNLHRVTLADLFLRIGRYRRADPLYKAVLDDPESGIWHRRDAHHGIAACALRGNLAAPARLDGRSALKGSNRRRRDLADPFTARRHAEAALAISEAVGDEANTCYDLEVLAVAVRLCGDLATARQVNDRFLAAATRSGDNGWSYLAVRSIIRLAIEERDGATARSMLPVLAHHASIREDSEVLLAGEIAWFRKRIGTLP